MAWKEAFMLLSIDPLCAILESELCAPPRELLEADRERAGWERWEVSSFCGEREGEREEGRDGCAKGCWLLL